VIPVRYELDSYILFSYRPTECICVFRMVLKINSEESEEKIISEA
jgi:hypothetical protein